ncbi:MAG: flagellar hook-associated family protein, partial [Mesorhizobium sp.]
GRTTQAVTFQRDLDRLNGIVDSNSLVAARLTSTQDSLGQLSDVAQDLLTALTSAVSGDSSTSITQTAGATALQQMTGILNTSVNGEYLFAGTNTDVKPIDDFSAAGSPAKAAFDAAFTSYFGFTQNDPAAANITAAQMDDFITTAVEPQFLGSGWQANWSNATDDQITSRISLNETTQTSVSANEQGIRKLAMAAAMVGTLFAGNISEAGFGLHLDDAGLAQKRVSDASDRMKTQVDLFEKHIIDLEGVDPSEAATRVADLTQHIETSFALTARLQQLSLLNYLT